MIKQGKNREMYHKFFNNNNNFIHNKKKMQRKKENRKRAKIAVVGDDEEIFENITKQNKIKSPFDYQLILNAFNTQSIFN